MLADYVEQFKTFRVNQVGGTKVHKPLMLLTVIDLAERGVLVENEVRYDDALEGFREYAEAIRPKSHLHPYYPFYHLKTSRFWRLDVPEGSPTHRRMLGQSAALTPELHRLLCSDAMARFELRKALIERWFPDEGTAVWRVIERKQSPNEYESSLRQAGTPLEPEGVSDSARSSSFRRLVLEAYDYRCAATGWRILLPGTKAMVEAAHLIPWAESHDDRPSNGIALTPTYHRALDWHLIAPGPDMKWHVSKALDKRIPDNREFLELAGQDVIFYGDRHPPSRDALAWRVGHLLGA